MSLYHKRCDVSDRAQVGGATSALASTIVFTAFRHDDEMMLPQYHFPRLAHLHEHTTHASTGKPRKK